MTTNAQIKLDKNRVPVLPPNIQYLLKSLTDEKLEFHEIAQTIEPYPSITARLIGLANSAWSSPASPVTSIEVACSRLGMDVVRSTCIALVVSSPFNTARCPTFDGQIFWARAMLVAEVCTWLAQASENNVAVDTLRTTGLLHNLGLLLMADQLPDEVNQVLLQHQKEPDSSLGQMMLDVIGYDYAESGAFVGQAWGLPPCIVESIRYQREFLSTQNNVNTAVLGHACAMIEASERNDPWVIPLSLPATLAIRAQDAEKIYSRIEGYAGQVRKLAEALF